MVEVTLLRLLALLVGRRNGMNLIIDPSGQIAQSLVVLPEPYVLVIVLLRILLCFNSETYMINPEGAYLFLILFLGAPCGVFSSAYLCASFQNA